MATTVLEKVKKNDFRHRHMKKYDFIFNNLELLDKKKIRALLLELKKDFWKNYKTKDL